MSFSDLPKIHKRSGIVENARLDLGDAVNSIFKKYRLTHIEMMKIMLEVATRWNHYALKDERHPHDKDKGADEE